jgi:hypothetical protein|tara:strand:+ start:1763 stop:2206 length:444 start_codon:yes stop_codon:yes gene_type:complete
MNFIESVKTDMYSAMKSGDKDTSGTLRTLLAKLKDRQINSQKDITEEECMSVIKTLVKQRLESAEMYEKAERDDLANKEKIESRILSSYLPQMLSENEIRELVQSAITETKAEGLEDIGKVMPLVMKRGGGAVDGKTANKILREILE